MNLLHQAALQGTENVIAEQKNHAHQDIPTHQAMYLIGKWQAEMAICTTQALLALNETLQAIHATLKEQQ